MFECPGEDWHDGTFHPDQLHWMAEVQGNQKWSVDGFYCSTCIFVAKRSTGTPIITGHPLFSGPSLQEELDRRGVGPRDLD